MIMFRTIAICGHKTGRPANLIQGRTGSHKWPDSSAACGAHLDDYSCADRVTQSERVPYEIYWPALPCPLLELIFFLVL